LIDMLCTSSQAQRYHNNVAVQSHRPNPNTFI